MTRRDEEIPLRHMLDHAREAVQMAAEYTRSDLDSSRILELALVRLVEIFGEAAGRVNEETRARHPSIPSRQVVGMRNRLIHGYDAVDRDILWTTISDDEQPADLAALAGEGEEVIDALTRDADLVAEIDHGDERMSRSYSSCPPIQSQTISSPVVTPRGRWNRPTRTDLNRPVFLK